MLIHWMIVVIAPEEVISHFVPLVQSCRANCVYFHMIAVACALSDLGIASTVRVTHKSLFALTFGIALLISIALCSEPTFEDTALV